MTAVALLFSIYMVKPSPFCILDELDAPLDESNIGRFLNMLDRFIAQSQFIIVTHNKRTMSRADVIYGVTMQEFGVSKPIGVRMAPQEDAAPKELPLSDPEPVLELEAEVAEAKEEIAPEPPIPPPTAPPVLARPESATPPLPPVRLMSPPEPVPGVTVPLPPVAEQ